MLDSLLAEYQWPANSKNAARAGWEAANRWLKLAATHPKEPTEALGDGTGEALEAVSETTPALPAIQWPAGLLDRIKAAEQRVQNNDAPRRIPADPHGGDVDLVLAEVRYLIEGRWPPFWIAPKDGGGDIDGR